MQVDPEILARIPHRPPFLWLERIIEQKQQTVITEITFAADLDLFRGHYPGQPLVPGVILCEALLQSGALLMSYLQTSPPANQAAIPVVTRIQSVKFKQMVGPGDSLRIATSLLETVGGAMLFKGKGSVRGKTTVQAEFICLLTSGSTATTR